MARIYMGWTAYFNDREENHKDNDLGPTLTFFLDEKSEYKNKDFDKLYIFRQNDILSERIYNYLKDSIQKNRKELNGKIDENLPLYEHKDPTNYKYLQKHIEKVCRYISKDNIENKIDEIIIHISPGTPPMQHIWALNVASGMIRDFFSKHNPSFVLVKTMKEKDRKEPDKKSTENIKLDFEKYYKSYEKLNSQNNSKDETPEEIYKSIKPEEYKSEKMIDLINRIDKISKINCTILILGERGVGKTTFAQWIRYNDPNIESSKKDNPLLALSCGLYTSDLLRSELCGYVKGAYTGATKNKNGLFKKCDDDILFLDEIGDCSMDMQGVIIRTIEEKKYLPIGAENDEKSEFRLITATNLSIKELSKKLRKDFFDRISLITITVPPLREIREDIPIIWKKVWNRIKKKAPGGWNVKLNEKWETELISHLKEKPLYGNIRDLQKIAYNILVHWRPTENRAGITAGEIIEDVLDNKEIIEKNISNVEKKVSLIFNENEKIKNKEYDKLLKKELLKEVNRRKDNGEEIKNIIDVDQRTLKNWEKL